SNGAWQQLRFDLETKCRNVGVDAATIQNVNGFAERLAYGDDVFQFGDDSSFARAKEAKDEQKRNELLVRGIWNLIQGKRFQEVETKLNDVNDREIRSRLSD